MYEQFNSFIFKKSGKVDNLNMRHTSVNIHNNNSMLFF